jgi:hypothetical protein
MTTNHGDTESTEEFISFWRGFSLNGPVYFHPDDQNILKKNRDLVDFEAICFSELISERRKKGFKDKLRLSLISVPFSGDLRKADIIVLQLNPIFSFSRYFVENNSSAYRQRLEANLKKNFSDIQYPFIGLDPSVCWHPAFEQWEGKLHKIITEIANARFSSSYICAMKSLSSRIAAVELVPYYSQSFSAKRLIKVLPSANAARRYAQNLDKRKLVIVCSAKNWGVKPDGNRITSQERQGLDLSPESDKGKAILRQFDIAS